MDQVQIGILAIKIAKQICSYYVWFEAAFKAISVI